MATIDPTKQDVTDLVISKRPITFKLTKANIIKYDESKKLLYVSSFSTKTFKDKISDNDPETPDKEISNDFRVLTPIIISFEDIHGVEMRIYNDNVIETPDNSDEKMFIKITTVINAMIENPHKYYLVIRDNMAEPAYVKSQSTSKIVLEKISLPAYVAEDANGTPAYYNTFITLHEVSA